MKADSKNSLFGWKATRGPNISLIDFFIGDLFDCKVGQILLAADRK